jgi:hypothetical protein
MTARNIVLTGVPRSGTTLTCSLLNKLPDILALAEPISPGKFSGIPEREAIADGVERFFRRMRRMALNEGKAISKNIGGAVPDNGFEASRSADGARRNVMNKGKIDIGKKLSPDFDLIIKSPNMFSALLPTLKERFPCYAIVRNPLAVLASESSIRASAQQNSLSRELPPGLRYSEHLGQALATTSDRLQWSLYLLDWRFDLFARELPRENVIRYEDVISSGGKALSAITSKAKTLNEPLKSRNLNEIYDRDEMLRLGERLLASEGAYWTFYTRESVAEILYGIS